jgi:sugar lactone lactonase YvrE
VVSLTAASIADGRHPFVSRAIVKGAPIHGTNGIYFDAEDRLHIASFLGDEILVMDPQSGEILDRLGPADGVSGPDDLTFGSDGSLYWTSLAAGRVGRRTPAGVTTTQFVTPGVNPITFSEDGRLFVALDFFGDGLYELDPEQIDPPKPIIIASAANPMPLGFLNGMDFGPDGRLYGPLYTQGKIISLDVDSCSPVPTNDPWNDCDLVTVADGFGVPAAVKFDAHGNLFAIDQVGLLYQVDVASGEKSVVTELSPSLDNLAFDSHGRLYVSSAAYGFIVEILPSNQPRTVSPGGIIAAGGIAVMPRPDGGDSLFTADVWALRQFDGLTGRSLYTEDSVAALSQIISPFTVSADGQNLVLSSYISSKVQVWDPVGHQEVASYAFPAPLNAIGFQGDVVVADVGMAAGPAPTPR